MRENDKKRIVIAITGASGAEYALATVSMLKRAGCEIFCIASDAAKDVALRETECELAQSLATAGAEKVYDERDFDAPCASGSFYFDAMAVVPCSMKTLGKIANSIADNLVVRAAEVALKERRRLVVVPRETPLAITHLKNMLEVAQAGAVVLPACPAFYHNPKSAGDLVDFVAARVVSSMGIKQDFLKEWGYEKTV